METNKEKALASSQFIGVFTLAMICTSAIVSLRNLPTTALLGPKAITFYVTAAVCFFIPIAIVCAELSAAWPKKGGLYLWVDEAFGPPYGVLVIWLEWIGSVVWLPGILSFLASTTSYLFEPSLENNKWFLITLMLIFLWGGTFINFKGIWVSSRISTLGVLFGTLIPAILLTGLGFSHFGSGIEHGHLEFSLEAMMPNGNTAALVIFTSILLGFAGMEIPAYYVQNVENPRKNYPKAMFLAAGIILAISILGSLAISAVIPKENISLVSGTMQSFQYFFDVVNLPWLTPVLSACLLIGGLALLNTWLIGPSRGLLAPAEKGQIPSLFKKTNNLGVPTALLLAQAIVGSLLISAFVFNPTIKSAYWMLNTLAAQIYLVMYALVFLAAIKLRYKAPHQERPYRVPGGIIGMWFIAGLGAMTCFAAIIIGFIPPEEIDISMPHNLYMSLLILGMIIFCFPPLIYLKRKKYVP